MSGRPDTKRSEDAVRFTKPVEGRGSALRFVSATTRSWPGVTPECRAGSSFSAPRVWVAKSVC